MGKLEDGAFRGGMSKKEFERWRERIISREYRYRVQKENVDYYKKWIKDGVIPPESGKDSVDVSLLGELINMNYQELEKIEREQKNR
jgi:hypothetical protein